MHIDIQMSSFYEEKLLRSVKVMTIEFELKNKVRVSQVLIQQNSLYTFQENIHKAILV